MVGTGILVTYLRYLFFKTMEMNTWNVTIVARERCVLNVHQLICANLYVIYALLAEFEEWFGRKREYYSCSPEILHVLICCSRRKKVENYLRQKRKKKLTPHLYTCMCRKHTICDSQKINHFGDGFEHKLWRGQEIKGSVR